MVAKKGWVQVGVGKKSLDGLLEKISVQNGVPIREVVNEIQNLIDATWDNHDSAARKKQLELFPNGKPSIEEFIRVVAKQIKQ